MIIGLVTTAAVAAGLTGNAFAFSGGVSHVVAHSVAMTTDAVVAMPSDAAAAVRLRDVHRRHEPSAVSSRSVSGPEACGA
jgi:hypothetical protein